MDRELGLPYVGTLAEDNQVILKDGRRTLGEFAARLKEEHLQALREGGKPVFHRIGITYKGAKETYYHYGRTHRIHHYGKHWLVINFRRPDLSDAPVFYNSNRLYWQAVGIARICRHH